MDWYDVDDILYDGTKEEISKLKCPDIVIYFLEKNTK